MESKYEKAVGYILLILGVVMILISVYFMFSVFTGSLAPPRLFNFSDVYINIQGESTLIFSGEEMNKIFALIFWYLLMLFIMTAGGKIASLGINLIREIKVEVKK